MAPVKITIPSRIKRALSLRFTFPVLTMAPATSPTFVMLNTSRTSMVAASDAIIVGFQVRPSGAAAKMAEQEGVDIRKYSVIYDAIEEVKAAMEVTQRQTAAHFVERQHLLRTQTLFNERNQRMQEAGPSTPALILGLNGAPAAGDTFHVIETEPVARRFGFAFNSSISASSSTFSINSGTPIPFLAEISCD